jgi:hypothetical protein
VDAYTSRYQGVSPQPERAEAGTTVQEPYFLGLNRAMVSLGPLTDSVYCTFKCKFCYVNGPYRKYARRSVGEILDWLNATRDDYDIIYVSGDTDSFAKPRTHDGLRLLRGMTALKSDVLFTTRHVFSGQEREELKQIIASYAAIGKLFIPCISVSQLNYPALEPAPIASPEARLEQIKWFHDNGAKVILTVRPFLPYLPGEEYAEITRQGAPYSAAVLGGDWYTDLDGTIDEMTRGALGVEHTRVAGPTVSRQPLDSTSDTQEWLITRHPEAEASVACAAREAARNFYMRSSDLIKFLRQT